MSLTLLLSPPWIPAPQGQCLPSSSSCPGSAPILGQPPCSHAQSWALWLLPWEIGFFPPTAPQFLLRCSREQPTTSAGALPALMNSVENGKRMRALDGGINRCSRPCPPQLELSASVMCGSVSGLGDASRAHVLVNFSEPLHSLLEKRHWGQ